MGGTLMLMMEKGEIGKVKTVLLNKSIRKVTVQQSDQCSLYNLEDL
jgi:hypothetical protein